MATVTRHCRYKYWRLAVILLNAELSFNINSEFLNLHSGENFMSCTKASNSVHRLCGDIHKEIDVVLYILIPRLFLGFSVT